MNIVFCHGVMDPEQDWNARTYNPTKGWKYWLQFMAETEHDVIMQIPQFPHGHALLMKYDEWAAIMDRQDSGEDTVLIGHSAGGGFVLKYLAMHPNLRIRQAVLVAPWIDVENFQPFGFYQGMRLSNDLVVQTKEGIDLMISDDDDSYILGSADKIMKDAPAVRLHRFSGRGHFLSPTLPELLQIIKFE